MTVRLAALALALAALPLAAQPAPKGPKKKDDAPAGYKKDNLRGFTLFFNKDVFEEDANSKLKRKPLEALERELIIVETVLPADKVKKLKAVPIWVEWDERIALGNGRGGRALAVFYGGPQASLLGGDANPLKSNAVTILSLRSLAAEHQPDTDSGRCVTLHELAHAYHHHVVGDDSPQVKATYKQAMERKLYDPALYVATNDHEYFAELTCCYLEKLDYFPRTRDDLKKHDPKGYELMEKTWGRVTDRKDPALLAAKLPKLASPDGEGRFPLTGTTERIKFGTALVGDMPDRGEWAGRPVLGVQFAARSGRALAALARLSTLYTELQDYGLIAFGSETQMYPDKELRKLARQRSLAFPLVAEAEFGIPGSWPLPHAYVYDHAGKCVFRGSPLDAEPYVRVAVGKAVLAQTGKEAFGKPAQPVADLLTAGAPMGQVVAKLTEQLRAAPKDDELKELQAALTSGGKKVLDAAAERAKADPIGAFFDAERLPAQYRGTPVEKPASDLVNKLKANPKVERELKGRAALAPILKLDSQLSGKDLSFDPHLLEFKEDNAMLLKQLADAVEKLRKTYANTRAADEAARLAERWDVKGR
jgi:hypothetical protein